MAKRHASVVRPCCALQAGLRDYTPLVAGRIVSGSAEYANLRGHVVIQMLRVDQLAEEFFERRQCVLTALERKRGTERTLSEGIARRGARHRQLGGRLRIDQEPVDGVGHAKFR